MTFEGYKPPIKVVDGVEVPKPISEWKNLKKEKWKINAKVVSSLWNTLWRIEYGKIFHLRSAKEIWKDFETTHEGTNHVKETKLYFFGQQYEMFKMDNN